MAPTGKPIGEMLVEAKALSRQNLEEALKIARPPGKKLGQLLIELGFVTEAQLTQSLSLQLNVPWVSLYHIDFSRELLNRVPRELAEQHCLVPIFVRNVKGQGDTIYVAIEDPGNEIGLSAVVQVAGLPVRPMIASPSDIRSALRVYYGDGSEPEIVPIETVASAAVPTDAKRLDPPPLPSTRRTPVASTPPAPLAPSAPAKNEAPGSAPKIAAPLSHSVSVAVPDSTPTLETGGMHAGPKSVPRMVALTLLDGTSIQVPARSRAKREAPGPSEDGVVDQLTARDLISALRAATHGVDASEVLGDKPQWEAMFAALLSLLLKKGLIADWEFVEELRKI